MTSRLGTLYLYKLIVTSLISILPLAMSNIFLFIVLTSFISALLLTRESQDLSKKILRNSLGLNEEKQSHLHFYFHDIVSGRNPTAVRVASAAITNTSSTYFGAIMMMDDPLTEGPEPSSKQVGRAQGIYASASSSELAFLMVLNYAFTDGEYNGSTLSILGRNPPFAAMREMPVLGGTGVFRFARGYAQAQTHNIDLNTGDAIVEYNVYVFH